jgi:hypothetical protein
MSILETMADPAQFVTLAGLPKHAPWPSYAPNEPASAKGTEPSRIGFVPQAPGSVVFGALGLSVYPGC